MHAAPVMRLRDAAAPRLPAWLAWACILLAKACLTVAAAHQLGLLQLVHAPLAWLAGACLLAIGIGLLARQEPA